MRTHAWYRDVMIDGCIEIHPRLSVPVTASMVQTRHGLYWIVVFAVLILLIQPCAAAECPEFDQFFKEINPTKKTWNDLYRLFTAYSSACGDGAYADGYSDFVAQSLAKYWDRLDELVSLIKRDPNFKHFVLRQIDGTDSEKDIKMLLNNARKHCPSAQSPLCKEIEKAALSVLQELEQYE